MKIILKIFFIPLLLFGQSEYVNQDHFGFLVSYGVITNDILSGSGVSLGFSTKGNIEFGVEFINSEINEEYTSAGSKPFSNFVYLAYNIKRKQNFSNMKIILGYLTVGMDKGEGNSGIALGLSLALRAYESSAITLIPSLSMIYGFLENEETEIYLYGSNYFSKEKSYIQNTRSLSLGLGVQINIYKSLSFILDPSISRNLISSENSTSYSISGGILLDFKFHN